MKDPVVAIIGNLAFASNGDVWAGWRVRPQQFSTAADRTAAIRVAAQAVPESGDILFAGLTQRVAAVDIVERLSRGCEHLPSWVADAQRIGDVIERSAVHTRTHWIFQRISADRTFADHLWAMRRGFGAAGRAAGLAHPEPSAALVETSADAADIAMTRLPVELAARPATAEEMAWIYRRAPRLGTAVEPAGPLGADGAGWLTGANARILARSRWIEGSGRRFDLAAADRLTVHCDGAVSHQAVLFAVGGPQRWDDGQCELAWRAERAGRWPVDWWMRMNVTPPDKAAGLRLSLREREMEGGADETSGMNRARYSTAATQIADYTARLAADADAARVTTHMAFVVAAGSHREVARRVARLREQIGRVGWTLAQPTGTQTAAVRAMLPCAAPSRDLADLALELMPPEVGSFAPFAGSQIGDPFGALIGENLTSAGEPVLVALEYGPTVLNESGNVAISGTLGFGKSMAAKTLGDSVARRGGQWIAVDQTEEREYARLARFYDDAQVVEATEDGSTVGLDPMINFPGEPGREMALAALQTLLGVDEDMPEWVLLSRAVDQASTDGIGMGGVVDLIEGMEGGANLAVRLRRHARSGPAAALFVGGQAGAVNLSASFLCFRVSIPLPPRPAEGMPAPDPKPFRAGLAVLEVIAATIAHMVANGDRSRHRHITWDEAWRLLATTSGPALIRRSVFESRRMNASNAFISQDDDHFDDEQLRHIPTRLAFHAEGDGAIAAARFVGADDPQVAQQISTLTNGRCVMRHRGQVAVVGIIRPLTAGWVEATDTTPKGRL